MHLCNKIKPKFRKLQIVNDFTEIWSSIILQIKLLQYTDKVHNHLMTTHHTNMLTLIRIDTKTDLALFQYTWIA